MFLYIEKPLADHPGGSPDGFTKLVLDNQEEPSIGRRP
jgi:hypothetical protein